MKIKELKPFELNPRKIDDEHLEMLKESMHEFGDISGIVYNVRTSRLCGGHQRQVNFDDSAEITITEVYITPTRTGTVREGYIIFEGERFTYREVDWPEEKEIAANIAANKGAGKWDYGLLQDHFNFLDGKNYDMTLTMHSLNEIQDVIGGWESDIAAIDKVNENLDGIEGKIKISCPIDIKDEVLIYIKAKLMETSFEGVHIE